MALMKHDDIKAVIWDHDNTLVPTAPLHFQKHKVVAGECNVVITDSDRMRIAENNGRQNWRWLQRERNLTLPCEDYLARIDAWYEKQIQKVLLPSGIKKALTFFERKKIPQAILSNGRESSLKLSVKANEFNKIMTLIWGKESYEERKTSPEPYIKICQALSLRLNKEISPEAVIFFDDEGKCVDAASQAGLNAFHVLSGPNQSSAKSARSTFRSSEEITGYFKSIL